jgi:putative dehydrogenase
MGEARDHVADVRASSARAPVGVIGLGIMGGAIARNLRRNGFEVIGYDTDVARAEALAMEGIKLASSVAGVAMGTDYVLTSLPSAAALDAVTSGIADAGRPGLIVAELSTLPLECKQRNRKRLIAADIVLLDCPLSGTGAQATSGDLVVYASGDAAACRALTPAFDGFARKHYWLGDFGNGTKMKFVANLLVAIHNVAAAEAIALGLEAGLDAATLVEIAGSGAGGSRVLELRGPLMVREEYEPATMKLEIWQKDMALIGEFAESIGVETPMFSAAAPIYDAALAQGRGKQDTAAVCAVLQERVRRPR